MPQINQLSSVSQLQPSDNFPIYSGQNGDTRKASLTTLIQFIQRYFASPQFQTQFATPGGSGFNVNIANTADNTWLVINPPSGFAVGSITLPAVANCADGQEVLVNCSQQVVDFSVGGNGAIAVQGAPTSLGADDFFRLRFHLQSQTWYRVG